MADGSPKPTYSPHSPPFSPPSPPPERNTPPTPGGRGMGRGRARGITVAPGPVGDGQMRRTRWGEETPVGSGFLSCKAEAAAWACGIRGARNFRTYKEKNLFRGTPRGRIQRAPTVRVTRSSSRLDGGNVLMEGLVSARVRHPWYRRETPVIREGGVVSRRLALPLLQALPARIIRPSW